MLGEPSDSVVGTDDVDIERKKEAVKRNKSSGGGVTRFVDALARTIPERVPRENVPENARIVCFPLEPKPDNVDAKWIRRFWLGVETNAGVS